jgi:hypothetical protein
MLSKGIDDIFGLGFKFKLLLRLPKADLLNEDGNVKEKDFRFYFLRLIVCFNKCCI